jgi:hypothetical protein
MGSLKFKNQGFAIEWCSLAKRYRYFGYEHNYYDGDFYNFGFWFFHIYLTTNPHCYLTNADIERNITKNLARMAAEKKEIEDVLEKYLKEDPNHSSLSIFEEGIKFGKYHKRK